MTVETYKKAMAELGVNRECLDTGIPEWSRSSIRATRVSHYLPGGEEKPMTPEPMPAGPSLAHLNPRPRGKKGSKK